MCMHFWIVFRVRTQAKFYVLLKKKTNKMLQLINFKESDRSQANKVQPNSKNYHKVSLLS